MQIERRINSSEVTLQPYKTKIFTYMVKLTNIDQGTSKIPPKLIIST